MIPLGPLNGKNFGTSISPWIITTDALEPYRAELPTRDTPIASYLEGSASGEQATLGTYDIRLQAEILTPGPSSPSSTPTVLCQSRVDSMYWSFRHLVAHQAVGGSGLRTGDMMATGTVSGSTPDSHGCLLEQTKGGNVAIELTTGGASREKRIYLEDGDQIRLSGWTVGKDGMPSGVGFGECVGTVTAAKI
jgi:fumarylacetoacetase